MSDEGASAPVQPAVWKADWQDPSGYPALDCWGWSKAWRWEFIRRRPDYETDRARWNAAAQKAHEDHARATAQFVHLDQFHDEAQHRAAGNAIREAYRQRGDPLGPLRFEFVQKWGLVQHRMLWPSSSMSDGWQMFTFPALSSGIMHVEEFWRSSDFLTYDQRVTNAGGVVLETSPSTVWLSFDVGRPLDKQLAFAKEILNELQSKKPDFRTRDPVLLRRLLRTLDARAAGVSYTEIARVLLPLRADGAHQVRRDLRLAEEMLTSGFLTLHVPPPQGT